MKPPAPTAPPAARRGRGLDWLRTREGKIVAGAAAALVVVVMALRKGAGGGAGGFVAQPQQGAADGTMQDRLDQLTGTGGTLDELRATTEGIAGSVDKLTDLVEAQDPATSGSTAAKIAELVQFNAVKANYQKTLDTLNAQRPGIVSRLKSDPRARGQLAALDKSRTQVGKSLSIVNQQIASRST